jgi:stage III sporulation protein AD
MTDTYLFKVLGIAIICVVAGALVKQMKNEISFAVKVAGSLLAFGVVILSLQDVLSRTVEIFFIGGFSEYVEVILKALGVAILTHIVSGICKDLGEGTLAGVVEFAGKVEILILSLPMIEELLKYTSEIASFGG